MEQSQIFEPVFVMLILTLLVWVYMYAKRIPFIQKSNFAPGELTPQTLQERSPPDVANPSDNLKNLFETPPLFYFMCVYLFITNQVEVFYLFAAWGYVAFRIVHSIIHCTVNIVMLRFLLYLASTLFLWAIVLRAAYTLFVQP